jgi:hypothetical protein
MNNRIALTTVAVLGMLTVGSSVGLAQDVTITVEPGVDFSNYRLYRWVAINGAVVPDESVDRQIKSTVERALESKGLAGASFDFSGQRSIFLAYQVAVKQPEQWKVYSAEGVEWYGASTSKATISVGAFELDMYDPATKKLVWQGRAVNTLTPTSDPKERQDRLNKAIAKLLEDFPPKGKK